MAEIPQNPTPPSVKHLPPRPRVVVVGGGFAGLSAGRRWRIWRST